MLAQNRIVSTLALAALGVVALTALLGRTRTSQDSGTDLERELTTWEGEGGSPAEGQAAAPTA
jgi:cell division septation protein DedD